MCIYLFFLTMLYFYYLNNKKTLITHLFTYYPLPEVSSPNVLLSNCPGTVKLAKFLI